MQIQYPNAPAVEDLNEMAESIAGVLATECDNRRVHEFIAGKNDLDAQLQRLAVELGWLGIGLPEAFGGLDLGLDGLAVLHRQLGRRLAPGGLIATLSAAQCLLEHADERQRARYLPDIVSGRPQIAIPADPERPRGGLMLRNSALHGRIDMLLGPADAQYAFVPFEIERGEQQWGMVEIDSVGARLARRSTWDATRSVCVLDCNRAPVDALNSTSPASVRDSLSQHLALAVSCDSVGGAEAILLQTVHYLKGRTQFDRVLASFQALKHRAANLAVEVEVSSRLNEQALDAAVRRDPDAALWTQLAKAKSSDMYALVTQDCLQLHGGVGFTWEFDCHLFLKRARLNQALAGDNRANLDAAEAALAQSVRAGRSVVELTQ